MAAVKGLNLALRFLLELCALGALSYWGASTPARGFAKVGLGIGTPLVAAAAWMLFVAPNAPAHSTPTRWVVEIAVFAGATAALAAVGRFGLAAALATAYSINAILMAVWDQ